jgi:phage baseplate assembly protein W
VAQRRDYAFPFSIDTGSGQAAQTTYAAHVNQMIRQLLLTSPGERADLPEFGCGLRQLVFAPHSRALDATTQLVVQQALERWLSGQVELQRVVVVPPEESGDEAALTLRVEYNLVETRTGERLEIRLP